MKKDYTFIGLIVGAIILLYFLMKKDNTIFSGGDATSSGATGGNDSGGGSNWFDNFRGWWDNTFKPPNQKDSGENKKQPTGVYVPYTFKEASQYQGGVAGRVSFMLSKSFKQLKPLGDNRYSLTIPPDIKEVNKISNRLGIYTSLKTASVVHGGIAGKVTRRSSLKTPALIKSIITGVGQGHKTGTNIVTVPKYSLIDQITNPNSPVNRILNTSVEKLVKTTNNPATETLVNRRPKFKIM